MSDGDIAAELVAMARADRELRAELASSGVLFGGYHQRMRALHERNAERLADIMQHVGWPCADRVGAEASRAAWLIAQHAISRPDIMRAAHCALTVAVRRNGAAAIDLAHLDDRIAVFEGRPQRYGTQFDWDATGEMSPAPIGDPDRVDERRASVGLGRMRERVAQMRADLVRDGETRPSDLAGYFRARDEFARDVGWR
jgi:hypothetical protein